MLEYLNGDRLWQTGGGNLGVDILAGLQGLLPADDLGDTLNEDVDQLNLGFAEAISVRDIPGATGRGGVNASGATGLETHASEQ